MSIEYTTRGRNFGLDYHQLKDSYTSFCLMGDAEFLSNLLPILHLSCVICFIKGVSPDESIGDAGIIHELVHLLDLPNDPLISLPDIRELFERVCKLA